MTMKGLILQLCILTGTLFTTSAQQVKKIKMADTVDASTKLYSLSTLWKETSYNFVWFDKQPKLNWDSVYQSYIPKVLKAANVFELNRVLTKFLEELKDGHTAVWTNQGFWDEIDQPPLSMVRFEGKLLVLKLDFKLKEKVPIKSEILKINGREAQEFLENDSWLGFKETEVKLVYKKPAGDIDSVTLKRNLNTLHKQGGFSYFPVALNTAAPKFKHSVLPEKISLIQINTFADPAVVDSFKQVLPQLKQAKALIIDLRNNGGGNSDYALEIAKFITDQPYLVGPSWKTRIHHAANKAWGSFNKLSSKSENYAFKEYIEMDAWESHHGDTVIANLTEDRLNKPVILLTSKNTYSAAEDFLIYLLKSKNIVRIGQASAGSSGQPLRIQLPLGMTARICAKRDALPDGKDYIGKGILPNIEIPEKPLFSSLSEDVELKSAIDYLLKKR